MNNMQHRNMAKVEALSQKGSQPGAVGSPLLRLLTMFALATTLAAGAMAESPPAAMTGGGKANAHINVGATVLRHIGIRALTAPLTLQISVIDIARGYVDVLQASTLEIRSNNPGGYLLAIDAEAEFSRGMEVRGSGGFALLGRSGGVLSFQANGSGMQTTPVALNFRVLLTPQARPGVYAWPIQISVLPA